MAERRSDGAPLVVTSAPAVSQSLGSKRGWDIPVSQLRQLAKMVDARWSPDLERCSR